MKIGRDGWKRLHPPCSATIRSHIADLAARLLTNQIWTMAAVFDAGARPPRHHHHHAARGQEETAGEAASSPCLDVIRSHPVDLADRLRAN
ncbi:hypothetical protein E2562_036030 [Oryza meyeriana var. granulata]|uniref:Uncharacterized protein n=1 Tax=Oryza meyeriana var. granulata TaxID=110450 RepID=A0A6G1CWZ0_9ORYZ|nr:hypothetical protein E2562_036030 [Oryza meyeriana var. granulata]